MSSTYRLLKIAQAAQAGTNAMPAKVTGMAGLREIAKALRRPVHPNDAGISGGTMLRKFTAPPATTNTPALHPSKE